MSVSRSVPLVTVCGLGPGSEELLTAQTAAVLSDSEVVYLRTRRHPSAYLAQGAVSFDHLYDQADSFAEVYETISDEIVEAAAGLGRVTYCVPGSPLVLERSVQHLRNRADIDVRLLPAISFLDEVWARLQVDPIDDGVRLVDGHRFGVEAAGERGPLLVAHAHAPWVLSDIKLSVADSALADDQPVVVLQALGTADERIFEVPWPELDRAVEPDHLTSLYFPRFAAPVAGSLAGSTELMRRLRNECPWDQQQDHASLRRFLLEETYEVLDALDRIVQLEASSSGEAVSSPPTVDAGPQTVSAGEALIEAYANLESELGDLLLQILFHARLASEAGQFGISDVAQSLIDKMVVRHPHVFGRLNASLHTSPDPADTFAPPDEKQWERLKAERNVRQSVLDDIPQAMPALTRSSKILKRTANAFGPPTVGPRLEALLEVGVDGADIGSTFLALVELARRQGIDPEFALREAMGRLEQSVRTSESGGRQRRDGKQESLDWVVG